MEKELKAFAIVVAKLRNLTTSDQLMDVEKGLIACMVHYVDEFPGKMLTETVAEIRKASKENVPPMSKGEIKESV